MLETHGYKQKFIWQFVHLNVLNLCVKFMRDQDQPFVVKPRFTRSIDVIVCDLPNGNAKSEQHYRTASNPF